MCGITGYFNKSFINKISLDEFVILKMIRAIESRGPNSINYYLPVDSPITLGHCRLAVVDLSPAGAQPMHSPLGRYVVAFNGEIYNHTSLRVALVQAAVAPPWRGHSDTETLLACFETWGIETTLSKVVGMFAIALWDKQERKLTLARDRIGEKPLYWGWQSGTLLFGSELKALKAHPDFVGEIDRNALALLLRHNYIPAPHSIYKGIYKLPAGHYVTIPHGAIPTDVQPQAYWRMNDAVQNGLANPFKGSDVQAVDALEAQLTESIALQMLADVPLGAFLSGGVDSSTVVALMQKQRQQRVRTFAIGFSEPGFNEAEHAKAVARHLGTEHTELYVGAQEALAVIPKLPHMYCEPFADSSQIPTYLVSQMARQHVTVALSGDGGDELFGGYNPYQFLPRVLESLTWLPAPLRSALQSMLAPLPLPAKLAKLREVMAAATQQDLYRQVLSHWPSPESLVLGAKEPATLLNTPDAWPTVDSFEHWMMAMDAQTYMVDDVLTKVDRAAMANSLETRVPLLDHRVVELAWRMPLHMKIRDGQGKWVLRQVLYKHVPKELIERPKKGFSIPLAAWLRGPLRDWAEDLLNESRLKAEGYLNPAPIRKAWLAHVQGKGDYSTRLWGVLMFQAWLEEHDRA
jgi:asparagine synthase (glutamine-hydrolysing)